MKNKYLILEDDTIAEKVTSDGEKISMKYSKAEIWNGSAKGKFVASLKDDGNKLKVKIFNKKLELEYHEFCYLYNLMRIKIIEENNFLVTTDILKIKNDG